MKVLWIIIGMMLLWSPFTVVHAAERESAYDRLMRTGVIRCGYVVYTPFYILDLNSGKVSGIFVDIMDEAAKLLSMKVEWTEEAGTPALIEGLKSGRLDALCSGFWPSAARGREVNFSRPLFYSNLGVYVRANDNRFDQSLDSLNQLGVTVAVVDGEMADQISTVSFPKAEKVSLPQTTNVSDLLTVVAFNKADFTISGVNEAADFSKHNPGKVKRVDAHKPIRVFPNVVMTEKGDQKFLSMLNSAFDELDQTGKLEQIISRYENQPGEFLRVARPYEVMEK